MGIEQLGWLELECEPAVPTRRVLGLAGSRGGSCATKETHSDKERKAQREREGGREGGRERESKRDRKRAWKAERRRRGEASKSELVWRASI